MSDLFIKIFNLAVTAGWIVLAVLLLRPLMRKAPKWISCLLWGIVGLRLVFPFSLESIFSLIPSAEPLPQNITVTTAPAIHSGIGVMNDFVNPVISDSLAPQVGASVNPMQIVIEVAAYIWLVGVAVMLGYGILSYILLRRKVRASVKGEGKLYFCDDVDSPFILGVLFPRIYLPSGMSGEALDHVLAHERAHLRRGDHVWKPLGFLLLSVYWFNPLIWIAYALLCRDIEAACDERVIGMMDDEAKKDYSRTLLACSMHRKRIMACPLAFGEVGVKQRIKSVLNYKKPAFWIIIIALVATVIVSVCFLTNPKNDVRDLLEPGSEWLCEDGVRISITVDNSVRMSGMFLFDHRFNDVVIRYGDGYAEVFRSGINDADYDINEDGLVSTDEYSDASTEHLILAGPLKARGDDFVLKIEEDILGIGQKELVFKKTKDSGNRTVKLPSEEIYVKVTDCGSDDRGADISFIQAKVEGGDVVFTLKWKNKSFKTQIYGESFEVYRYEGDELIPLEFIGYWKEVAIGVGAFSMTYPSFNITEHFDISALGKYRLVAGDAWVEFEVTDSLGLAFPYDIKSIGNGLFASIIDFGCDAEGLEVDFRTIQYRSGTARSFLIEWTNDTDRAHVIGPAFEVYRYEGSKLIPLENKLAHESGEVVIEANFETSYSYMVTDHYDISAEGKYRFESNGAWVVFEVKPLYDIYTSFDASNGLDVYVWQMAAGSYDFAVMPHEEDHDLSVYMFGMPGVNAASMRQILAAYDIDDDDVYIVPWQNPISSYIGDFWLRMQGEDGTAQQNMYIAIIRDMILGENVRAYYPKVYETEIFDIDRDGIDEICKVGLGIDSKGFSIAIRACESGQPYEYQDVFYIEPMSARFVCSADGKFRLFGKTEKGEAKMFDIAVKDGHVKLTENKSALGYFDVSHKKISLAEVDYSAINRIKVNYNSPGNKEWLQTSAELEKLLNFIKQIEAKDPESVSGGYGTYYKIDFCHDHDEVYSIAILPEGDDVYLVAGRSDTGALLRYSHAYKYKITNFTYDEIAEFLGQYVK